MPDAVSPTRHDPGLKTAGLRALDRLVAGYGPDGLLATPPTPVAAEALGETVRLLCAEARRAHPGRAERMVIALHAAWPTLPGVQCLRPGDGRDRLLERIITLAIAEFYASASDAGRDSGPTNGGVQ